MPFDFMGGKMASGFLLLVAALFILASIINPAFFQSARTSAADIVAPVLKAVNAPFNATAQMIGGVSGLTNLKAENARLTAENLRLREWYQTALMLQAENQSLQALLNVKVDAPHEYITARVISDAGNSFVKTLLVGVGSRDGVQKNQAVLSGDGLIGRVIEVGKNAARIMLITDFNSRVPVLLEGSSQKAILSGANDSAPTLNYIPADSAIQEGVRLVTSGDGGVFPKGLPIGRIETIPANKDEKIIVRPFSDLNNITNVRIINTDINPDLSRSLSSSLNSGR